MLGAIGLPLILVAILLEFRYLYLNTQRARARSRKYLHRWRLLVHHRVAAAARRARLFVMKPWRAAANPCRSSRMSALISTSSSRR